MCLWFVLEWRRQLHFKSAMAALDYVERKCWKAPDDSEFEGFRISMDA